MLIGCAVQNIAHALKEHIAIKKLQRLRIHGQGVQIDPGVAAGAPQILGHHRDTARLDL
jgi:hypothetical protein